MQNWKILQNLCSKIIVLGFPIVPKRYDIWLIFLRYDLRTITVMLWKSIKPVSNAHEFWKLRTEFVNIKSIVLGLSGFSKHAGTWIKFFNLWKLQKSLIWMLASSTLMSPIRNTFSYYVRRVSKLCY